MPEDKVPAFEPWPTPDWSRRSPAECLEEVRCYVEQRLEGEFRWYRDNLKGPRRASRWLRALAIICTAAGGLIPVLKAVGILAAAPKRDLHGLDLGQLGYLFLAFAGGFAVFDRFFGFSTAWMRYVTAMLDIEKVREVFRLDWVMFARRLGPEPDSEVVARMLEVAKRALLKAKDYTEKETEAWISEFKSNLAQLEKDLRAQNEAARPGAIDVRVKDASKATAGFELCLDQMVVERATGTSASIGHVAPGLHKVTVTAMAAGKAYAASQIVNVLPCEIVQLELELGIP